jgi:hypothetical protein
MAPESTRLLTVRVTAKMADKIDSLASQSDMSRNGVVNMLLSFGMRSEHTTALITAAREVHHHAH